MKILYLILFVSVSFNVQAAAPTVPSSNLSFNAIDGGYFNLGWTAGNGSRRLIICKAGGPVTFVPQNGVDYTENTIFGSGQQVAPGEYVIYDHFSTSFFLTGLTPATQYFFRIYDYNGTGAAIEYLTNVFLSGSATTSATPTVQTSNAVFTTITTNSVNLTWTNGNGFRRLIVVREGAPVNTDPVSNQQYNVSSQFGNGATTGPGNYTVYNSTGTGTNVANLRPGTQYFFAFYEFNGSSQPQYLTPAYTTSVTTRSIPTVASSNLVISKTDGKELSLNWTNGNGQRRIVVAKQGSNISANPANGTDYNANPVFGSGQQLGAGEYVVYDDNFNATTISGLNPATTYYFKIFEYDGTGSNTAYLTSSFASVNGPTAVTPTIQAANLTAGDITSNSLRLQFSSGNGRTRTIIGRKDAPVSVTPADFTLYTADANFGNGQDLGNGNFVLGNSTGELINIHNLQPNSSYHFAVFEYNGFNQPLYLSPATTVSATTSFALPVKLVKWEATPANGKVKLQWITASEVNASHFVIERSADGMSYTLVATVQAAGNSTTDIQYSKEDANPLAGKSYYRLKMVDLDGKTEYSTVRTVIISASAVIRLAANPVQDKLELIASAVNDRSEWQIINAAGQAVSKGTVSNGRTEINVAGLRPGNYWVTLVMNNEVQALAFVKL
ncbi:MAG: T9SS type A sorting domain-containing protein [Chitinophagaceae bacterium]|nr:T9SS type A sorting domain-containing protein [Chitinophagaceae bacterium]